MIEMDKQEIYDTLNENYFSENCHEQAVLDHFGELLHPGAFFVDIGASLGQFTKFAAMHLQCGAILSIEADPIRFEELERNATAWSKAYQTPIEVLHAAVSDTTESVTFYTTNSNVSGGLFPNPEQQQVNWQPLTVPAATLDNLFIERIPDLIKVDIEGGELKMLQGAHRLLAHGRTAFLIELHGWAGPDGILPGQGVKRIMKQYGYLAVSFYGKTLFTRFGTLYLRQKARAGIRVIMKLIRPAFERPAA